MTDFIHKKASSLHKDTKIKGQISRCKVVKEDTPLMVENNQVFTALLFKSSSAVNSPSV